MFKNVYIFFSANMTRYVALYDQINVNLVGNNFAAQLLFYFIFLVR